MKILALLTNKTSNNRQVICIANKIHDKYPDAKIEKRKIFFNMMICLPNFINKLLPIWMLIKKNEGFGDLVDQYDLIISCGRQSARYAKHIRKHAFPEAKIVQILKPDLTLDKKDIILLPSHDRKNFFFTHQKLLTFNGSLYAYDVKSDEYIASRGIVSENINNKKIAKEFIGVLIGGDSKHFTFGLFGAMKLINKLNDISHTMKMPLYITTSPRTKEKYIKLIKKHLSCDYLLYNHKEQNGCYNPYHGIIDMSKVIIATGDSISMISEVIASRRPLYIYTDGIKSKKYQRFHSQLLEHGQARKIPHNNQLEDFSPMILNNVDDLVNQISSLIAD